MDPRSTAPQWCQCQLKPLKNEIPYQLWTQSMPAPVLWFSSVPHLLVTSCAANVRTHQFHGGHWIWFQHSPAELIEILKFISKFTQGQALTLTIESTRDGRIWFWIFFLFSFLSCFRLLGGFGAGSPCCKPKLRTIKLRKYAPVVLSNLVGLWDKFL